MKKLRLMMVLHGHQPVGNLDSVFESACNKCYEPVLACVKEHGDIRLGLHFSGCLLEWLEDNRPSLIDTISGLVSSGQVELLGGGMYEPILTAIPEQDAITQLDLMSTWLTDRFGVKPKGAWLAERVWEPQMAGLLSGMDYRYTLLDEIAIQKAGIIEHPSEGYWITEQTGQMLNVFPISRSLRYAIPFKSVDAVLEELQQMHNEHFTSVTFSDDVEKLGFWNGTEKTAFEDKWWDRFLSSLSGASGWLETSSPSDVMESCEPRGRIYPPSSSYPEMEAWALPFSTQEQIQKSGDTSPALLASPRWQGFLTKYPEAARLHNKMLLVSAKLLEALDDDGPWEDEHEEARYSLLRAQCHCAYWHGLFGGLYLPHLRHAVYSRLIKAESILDRRTQGDEWIAYDEMDLDADGKEEIILEHGLLSVYLDPAKGGVLAELDYRPSAVSLTDTMTRTREILPTRGTGEQEDDTHQVLSRMVKDRFVRRCFMDRFPSPSTTLEELQSDSYVEEGDCLQTPYVVKRVEIDEETYEFHLDLTRNATIRRGDIQHKIFIEKSFLIPGDQAAIQVHYKIENTEDVPVDILFCPELNLSLPPKDHSKQRLELDSMVGPGPRARSSGDHEDTPWIALVDDASRLRLDLYMQPNANVWRFPIETVSRSHAGWESNYQGTVIVPRWEITIPAGSSQELTIRLSIGRTEDDTVVPVEIEPKMN